MSTTATGYTVVLDPKAYEGIHLLETDGIPMDTIWHRDCMMLLIEVVTHHNRHRDDFLVGGNNFIYFNPDQARNLDYRGPDFFYVKNGVDRSRPRKYWAVWEENGRLPDVVLELLSPTTAEEDRTTKFVIYEKTLRVPEYFLYDPETEALEGHRLSRKRYKRLKPNDKGWLWSEEMGLWLGKWQGAYHRTDGVYLRMYTPDGELVPLAEEYEQQRAETESQRAETESQRAETERQRAESAERELARLRELLRQQGVKPNGGNSAGQ